MIREGLMGKREGLPFFFVVLLHTVHMLRHWVDMLIHTETHCTICVLSSFYLCFCGSGKINDEKSLEAGRATCWVYDEGRCGCPLVSRWGRRCCFVNLGFEEAQELWSCCTIWSTHRRGKRRASKANDPRTRMEGPGH